MFKLSLKSFSNLFVAAIFTAGALFAGPSDAQAKCADFGYTVNDYGKEKPIADSKRLLDVSVAKWMKEKRIKNYKVGPKKVGCYLFLDVGFFDEYTCRADAKVCWNERIITSSTKKRKK